jgi:hypothetical protein
MARLPNETSSIEPREVAVAISNGMTEGSRERAAASGRLPATPTNRGAHMPEEWIKLADEAELSAWRAPSK